MLDNSQYCSHAFSVFEDCSFVIHMYIQYDVIKCVAAVQ